jgi:hypothetical protein
MKLFKKLRAELTKGFWRKNILLRCGILAEHAPKMGDGDKHSGGPLLERILSDASYSEEIMLPLACGLVCSKDGRHHCSKLFPNALWLDSHDAKSRNFEEKLAHSTGFGLEALKEGNLHVVMQGNHGISITGRSMDDVGRQRRIVIDRLLLAYRNAGIPLSLNITNEPGSPGTELIIKGLFGSDAAHLVSSGPFAYAPRAVTSRGVILSGAVPFSAPLDAENARNYVNTHGGAPKVVVAGDRVYGLGNTERKAKSALDAAMESALIMQLADAFGGIRFLTDLSHHLNQDAA